jgi:hypothetical protein
MTYAFKHIVHWSTDRASQADAPLKGVSLTMGENLAAGDLRNRINSAQKNEPRLWTRLIDESGDDLWDLVP